MNKYDLVEIHKIALEQGYDYSSRQCIEEMAELTQALNKLWRYEHKHAENFHNDDSKEIENVLITNLTEEIADVIITVENLKCLLSISDDKINDCIRYKIKRYHKRR